MFYTSDLNTCGPTSMEHCGLELWVWCLEYGSGHGQLRTRVERVKLFLSLGLLALSLKANTGVHG